MTSLNERIAALRKAAKDEEHRRLMADARDRVQRLKEQTEEERAEDEAARRADTARWFLPFDIGDNLELYDYILRREPRWRVIVFEVRPSYSDEKRLVAQRPRWGPGVRVREYRSLVEAQVGREKLLDLLRPHHVPGAVQPVVVIQQGWLEWELDGVALPEGSDAQTDDSPVESTGTGVDGIV